MPQLAITLIVGYLLGSIPFGLIFTALSGAGDVRKIGSGNIGATNVLRTGKKWAAAATLLCDGGKGALAVYLGHHYLGDSGVIAGFAAFFGHLFPVWLKFKGGKGVATFFGIALMLNWMVGLLALATWIVTALISRISSLSALVATALTPAYFLLWKQYPFAALMLVLAVIIYFMHRENIARLLRGEEPRIGAK